MMKSIKLDKNKMQLFIQKTSHLAHQNPHQYEKIRINDNKIIFILYNSGSLVYEDNIETSNFINSNLNDIFNNPSRTNRKKNPKHDSSNRNNRHNTTSKDKKNSKKENNQSNNKYTNHKDAYTKHKDTCNHTNKRYYKNTTESNDNNTLRQQTHKKRYYKNTVEHNLHENEYNFNNNDVTISDYEYTIGSDEAGKGEWFGPLVVCAIATSKSENLTLGYSGVKDSKLLTKREINEVYERITKLDIEKEVIILKPFSYNKLYEKFKSEGKNLNHMLAYLHTKAIKRLLERIDNTNTLIIIDKFDAKKVNEYMNKRSNLIQIENGERFTPVAASSIIAKYHYEKVLNELEERYNIRLDKKTKIKNIDKNILDKVAKTHFKNVAKYM